MPGTGQTGTQTSTTGTPPVLTTQEYEGWSPTAYNDTNGIKTIGYGTNLDRPGMPDRLAALGLDYNSVRSGQAQITPDQGQALFQQDMNKAVQAAPAIVSTYYDQPAPAQQAINDMIYNMGPGAFGQFKNTIANINNKNYADAATSLSKSLYAQQTGRRAQDIISMFNSLGNQGE